MVSILSATSKPSQHQAQSAHAVSNLKKSSGRPLKSMRFITSARRSWPSGRLEIHAVSALEKQKTDEQGSWKPGLLMPVFVWLSVVVVMSRSCAHLVEEAVHVVTLTWSKKCVSVFVWGTRDACWRVNAIAGLVQEKEGGGARGEKQQGAEEEDRGRRKATGEARYHMQGCCIRLVLSENPLQ